MHPTTQLLGHEAHGPLQPHPPEQFSHFVINLLLRQVGIFPETEGDVFLDTQRIEKGSLLKDNTELDSLLSKLVFSLLSDVCTVNKDSSGVGFQKSENQF